MLILVWFEKSLTLHKLVDKVVLTFKTDDITGGRGYVDPHGQLQAVQGGMG